MTHKLLERALKYRAKTPTQKLILIIMASNTDGFSKCTISRKDIAEQARCCLKTVARCIDELKTAGLIKTRGHTIQMTLPSATKSKRVKTRYTEDFEDWWKVYPRRQNTSKLMAWRAYKKLIDSGVVDHYKLMGRTRIYSGLVLDLNPRYVPHAATWLNQERWDTVDDKDYKKRESLNTIAG